MSFRSPGPLLDWQASSLLEVFNAQFANSVTYGKFAVKDTQSVDLWFSPEINDQRVTISWYAFAAATIPLTSRQIDVRVNSPVHLTLPNAGPFVELVIQEAGPGNGQHSVALFPTDRPGPSLAVPSSALLIERRDITIGAAATDATFATTWYAGPATFAVRTGAAPGDFALDTFDYAGNFQRVTLENLAAFKTLTIPVFIPPKLVRLSMVNVGGASGVFSGSITPDHLRS